MPNTKKINDWINAINNYYAFALLVYGAALYVSGLSNSFVVVFMIATPIIAAWGGYLVKSYYDRRTLRHGFSIESDSMSYEIGPSRHYVLRYNTKLKARFDHLMVYSISYQWSGDGEESIPKLTGKGMRLMSPLSPSRKLDSYETSSVSTNGDWRYWFIAINPPVHKGDDVAVEYSQEFYDKRNEAKPSLYYFVRVPMKRLTLSVTFPKTGPKQDVTSSYIKPSQPNRPYAASGVEYDANKQWATWTIDNPKLGYCYRISWKNHEKV